MPFFQNPFADEFEGSWPVGDRQHMPTYVLKGNAGRGKEVVNAWSAAPYDLSGNDGDGNAKRYLKIYYCLHNFKNWATITADLTAGAALTVAEIVTTLNADALFAERFVAESSGGRLLIRQKKPITEFHFYIGNGQAETALGFNARAGVGELPTYLSRHTVANRFAYPDSEGRIVQLNPAVSTEAAVINNAVDARGASLGYSSGTVQADWQLLRGKAGLYGFQKGPSANAVDATKTTTVINYPAGAKAGDLAEKVVTQYDSSSVVVAVFHLPYTLASGDLITPP